MQKLLKKNISIFLCLLMIFSALPVQGFAAAVTQGAKPATLKTAQGNVDVEDDWDAIFPYGTFAFDANEATVEEGGDTLTLNLYRLGGTVGRATAMLQYQPAVVPIGEDEYGYSTATRTDDMIIEIENAQPISKYQAVGKPAEPEETDVELALSDNGDDYIVNFNAKFDSIKWQTNDGTKWVDVEDANDSTFVVEKENYENYDFRAIFELDGTSFCTTSVKGEKYTKPEEEKLPEMPDDIDLDPEVTFTTIETDKNDPYLAYNMYLVFADGEWKKSIKITVPDNDRPDCIRQGLINVVDCEGGSVYDVANSVIFAVTDNDDPEPFSVGFDVTDIKADKADGNAYVTVSRTGGNQEAVIIKYKSKDGSAKKGKDFEAVEGEMTFYGDAMSQTITVPLIDDQKESKDAKEFSIELTQMLGDSANIGQLTSTVATISLVNSGTGEGNNLATTLATTNNAVDLSSKIKTNEESVVDVEPQTVTGEQSESEELEGSVVLPKKTSSKPGGPLKSYAYKGGITFDRYSIKNYSDNYWDYKYDVLDAGLSWSEGSRDGSAWILKDDTNKTASLAIPYMSKMYDYYSGNYEFNPELSDGWDQMWHEYDEGVYPWASLRNNIFSNYAYVDCEPRWTGKAKLSYYSTGSINKDLDMSNEGTGYLMLGLSRFDVCDSDDDAWCKITKGTFYRRNFDNNLNLTIHTANDGESGGLNIKTAPDGSAQLTTDSGVYASIKPSVSLISGDSGITSWGRLYVGSKIKVSLNKTASYFPYSGDVISSAVYLTRSDGSIVNADVTKAAGSDDYTITLVWDGMTKDDLSDTFTVNVVMTRKQSVKMDLAPSVERMTDENGNVLSSIDTNKITDAKDLFWGSGKNYVTVGYSKETKPAPHYETKCTKLNISSRDFNLDSTYLTMLDAPNDIQYINFNRQSDDKILFNGRMFDGDENIYLSLADLASANLVFRYYNKAYLSATSVMTTSIDAVGLFWDGNVNGKIDGKYNSNTGYFEVDESSDDEFVMYLTPGVDYNETMFNFAETRGGDLGQMYLKVFYFMTPRALSPQPGQENERAQVLTAFTTGITDPDTYSTLTDELQSYRYVYTGKDDEGNYTSDDHIMFGAAASAKSFVDIPLGGDKSPVEYDESSKSYSWDPDFEGNLLYPFENPQPIFIEHSLAGDDIPLAPSAELADGDTVLNEKDKNQLNGYLGSFVGNSAIALCVQQQDATLDKVAKNKDEYQPKPESSTLVPNKTTPDAQYLQNLSGGDDASSGGMDMSDSDSDLDEMNIDLGVDIPKLNFGTTDHDFISYSYDGLEHIISFSFPLGTWKQGDGWKGPLESAKDQADCFKDAAWFFLSPSAIPYTDGGFSKAAEQGKYVSSGFTAWILFTAAIKLKYDPVTNSCRFMEFAMGALANLRYNYTYRFTVCPLLYINIKVGIEVTLTSGGTFKAKTEESAPLIGKGSPTESLNIKKGKYFTFPINYKAVNLKFKGKLGVELYEDKDCTKKVPDANIGFLKNDGSKTITATLMKKDGYDFGGKQYYLKLSGLENTTVSSLTMITGRSYDLYWSGFDFSPKIFFQISGGIGVEIMKLELTFKITAQCAMTFYPAYTDDDFLFNSAKFAAAISYRVVFLWFSNSMDLIGYTIKYDGKTDKWSHSWNALGDKYGGDLGTLSMVGRDGSIYDATLHFPESSAETQKLYTQSEGTAPTKNGMLKAYRPTDDAVPFELAGYSSSSDAAKLADGLLTGTDYKVISVGDENYVLYHISRDEENSGNNNIDSSMLVLSKLVMNGAKPGLVNPLDDISEPEIDEETGANTSDLPERSDLPYIIVDTTTDGLDDGTGDLDFAMAEENGKINISWVSYEEQSEIGDDDTVFDSLRSAARNTVVKTATFDPQNGISAAETVSQSGSGNVSLPSLASDAITYVKSSEISDEELTARSEQYAKYLKTQGFDIESDNETLKEVASFKLSAQRSLWAVNGSKSTICVNVGGASSEVKLGENETVDYIASQKIGDNYYIAYTGSESYYTDASGAKTEEIDENSNLLTLKRLYLRSFKLNDSGEIVWNFDNQAVILRTLYDFDNNSNNLADGVYSNGTVVTRKDDPYFGSLSFLEADLGEALGGSKKSGIENFLLFDMNGATYLIRENDLVKIGTGQSGEIIPFFEANAESDEAGKIVSTGRNYTTIGAAGDGSLAAIYTQSVDNTQDTALYLSKFDKSTGSWGSGSIIAMNHLGVYEDNVKEQRSNEDAEKAFLGALEGYDNGSLDMFTFSNPQITFGQDENQLLVLTQGTMTYLKINDADNSEDFPVLPASDDEINSRTYPRSISAKPGVGVYAIGFGIGQQNVGEGYLSMPVYDFTAGADKYAKIGFVNTGDVGIRGSKDQPISVKLIAQSGNTTSELGAWTIEENIIPGQKVELDGRINISETLTEGSEIYINVSESNEYESSGGKAYSANTSSIFTVESKPELSVENAQAKISDIDENGNAVVDINFTAANRGTNDANGVKAVFSYNTGFVDEESNQPIYAPLDLSNASLSTKDVRLLFGSGSKADGTYNIGTIASGYGKEVSGTISISQECFNNIATGGLDLRVELFSQNDDAKENANGLLEGQHDEYNQADNIFSASLENITTFAAPAKLSIPLGNTLRVPFSLRYTTGDDTPRLILSEFAENEAENHLGIRSIRNTDFSDGSGSGTLVLSPSSEGSGFIRIQDTRTNSFFDIAYSVTPPADGINIYNDNDMFTFFNADGSKYDAKASSSDQDWAFDAVVPSWGADETEPYLGNLAKGKVGSSFTFETQAESISFIFDGEIKVESDRRDFEAVTISASGGSGNGGGQLATVNFGENSNLVSHKVTVTVTGTAGGSSFANFDRLVEHFSQSSGVPLPAEDSFAPHIYYSRSFPQTASIKNGEEVTIQAYILDDSGIASAAVDGKTPANISKTGTDFWVLDLSFSQNGTYVIDAVDDAGNRTIHTLEIDWFNTTVSHDASAEIPTVDAKLIKANKDGDDVELTDDVPYGGDDEAYISASAKASDGASIYGDAQLNVTYIGAKSGEGLSETPLTADSNGHFDASNNGWYLVTATDPAPNNSQFEQKIVYMTRQDTTSIRIVAAMNDDASAIEWSAFKDASGTNLSSIETVAINGIEQSIKKGQKSVSGIFPISFGGEYVITATDTAGNSGKISFSAPSVPIKLADGATANDLAEVYGTAPNVLGIFTIHPEYIIGGSYDDKNSTPKENQFAGKYDYLVVPKEDGRSIAELNKLDEWSSDVKLNAEAGKHVLYVRDALNKDNTDVIAAFDLTMTVRTTEHAWYDGTITTPATCVDTGIMTFVCLECGEERHEDVPIDPNNHTHIVAMGQEEPTCTQKGYLPGSQCLDCGEIITGRTVIPALGHEVHRLGGGRCVRCGEYRCKGCDTYERMKDLPVIGQIWTIVHYFIHLASFISYST